MTDDGIEIDFKPLKANADSSIRSRAVSRRMGAL
jgi:hypothetical protein